MKRCIKNCKIEIKIMLESKSKFWRKNIFVVGSRSYLPPPFPYLPLGEWGQGLRFTAPSVIFLTPLCPLGDIPSESRRFRLHPQKWDCPNPERIYQNSASWKKGVPLIRFFSPVQSGKKIRFLEEQTSPRRLSKDGSTKWCLTDVRILFRRISCFFPRVK